MEQQINAGRSLTPGRHQEDSLQQAHVSVTPLSRDHFFPREQPSFSFPQATFCTHGDKFTHRLIWPACFLSQNCNI